MGNGIPGGVKPKSAHSFLEAGAALKCENGRINGIYKQAFDATWSITDAQWRAIPERHHSERIR